MTRALLFLILLSSALFLSAQGLQTEFLSRYTNGVEGACEITAYDSSSQQLFVTNAAANSIIVLDVSNWEDPNLNFEITDLTARGGVVNSVTVIPGGFVAIALEDEMNKQAPGFIAIYSSAGEFVTQVQVGALPDMVTITPDGTKLIVACEGEPNDAYDVDPDGAIAIIDLSAGLDNLNDNDVTLLGFDNAPDDIEGGLQKPGTPWSQDLEPEYIAVSPTSNWAVAICQEANVFITIDLEADSILGYYGLGFKDHSLDGNAFDASNSDGVINISGYSGSGIHMATMAGKVTAEAIHGQMTKFDIMRKLPSPKFPGGAALRWPLLPLAMTWYALRDLF